MDTVWAPLAGAAIVLGFSFMQGAYSAPRQGEKTYYVSFMLACYGLLYSFFLLAAYCGVIDAGTGEQILLLCVMCVLTPLAMALWRRTKLWPWWIFAVAPVVVAALVALTMTLQSMHFEPLFSLDK